MGTSFAIFKRDLLRILRNPIALAVALGICVVPCLYAWINVIANWDPYENTSDMPIAVVNEDQPAQIADMGSVCAGDLMVDALKENDKIGWRFVGEDEAIEGVNTGTYYAAIIIPPDFSSHLTGILDGKTDKAKLVYYVNEKVNAIAPKVADTGATTLETTIGNMFIAKVGAVISEKFNGILEGIVDDSKTAVGKASTKLRDVSVALEEVDSQLGGLSQGMQDAKGALLSASSDLSSLETTGIEVADSLQRTLDNVSTTRAQANDLVTQINEKLGYGAGTISSLSSQATYDVSALAGDISRAQSQLTAAIKALESDLTDGENMESSLRSAREIAAQIGDASIQATITNDIDISLGVVVELNETQRAKLEKLRSLRKKLQEAATQIAAFSATINEKTQDVAGTLTSAQSGTLGTILEQVSSALDSSIRIAQHLETGMRSVSPLVAQLVAVTNELAGTLGEATNALYGTHTTLSELNADITELASEIESIQASEAWSVVQDLTGQNPDEVSEFLSAPVELNEKRLFPVENYASGVAPFFTSLALWVGGIALIAIFKLEVDEEKVGPVRPWQAYFGRWMLLVLLGILQAVICCAGDLIIGIQCAHPWAFFLSGIVASFAFVNVIYALSVAFKHLGKALAFTLIILQVPGSAGMYPIEMMPAFFQAINPWLPFTYSNNAFREAVAGLYDHNLAKDLLMLLLFVVPSILIGVTARSHLININALFDQRLRETDHLMVTEPVAIRGNHFRLASVVKAILAPEEYRATIDERSAAFERAYPSLKSNGVIALFVVPTVLFVLMLIFHNQLVLTACWVLSLVLIYAYLIVIEYYHDRVVHKRVLTDMSPEELELILQDSLRDEALAVAPIDAILERHGQRSERLERIKLKADDIRSKADDLFDARLSREGEGGSSETVPSRGRRKHMGGGDEQ